MSLVLLLTNLFSTFEFKVYQNDYAYYQQQQILQEQTNLCVDTALEEMIRASSMKSDYNYKANIEIDPNIALSSFYSAMCRTLNLPETEDAYTYITDNILKVFMVATYDGIYVSSFQEYPVSDKETETSLVFLPKIPYSYIIDEGKSYDGYYALNLENNDALYYNGSSISKVGNLASKGLTTSKQKAIIAEDIQLELNRQLEKVMEGDVIQSTYIPPDNTLFFQTNPIDNITVMAYCQVPSTLSYSSQGTSVSVGGTSLVDRDYVYGYKRSGTPYYCYASEYGGDASKVEAVFDNSTEAAKAGYYRDLTKID